MFKLSPVRSEKVWGYEDWIASVHPDLPQPELLKLAPDFPLLAKIIQANDTLSIQVHPDDKVAVELEGPKARGKTECWYVLDAIPGAKLVYGLKSSSTEEIAEAISSNTMESLLNQVEVKKGDFIYIPAGTVHAIGSGLRLMEVQQSCNITYRLYDWGRPRELHVEKSLEVLSKVRTDAQSAEVKADGKTFDGSKIRPLPETFECPYFSLVKKEVKGGYSYLASSASQAELLFVVSGKDLAVTYTMTDGSRTENQYIYPEEIYVVLPGEKVTVEGHGEVIRIKAK